MVHSLLQPPGHLSAAAALQLSQQAAEVLKKSPSTVSSTPLTALFTATESPVLWIKYENLLTLCLRTGDDGVAQQCLERLVARFGSENERVQAMQGLAKEAAAKDNAALEVIVKEYDQILGQNNTNIPVTKRRIALLRSLGRVPDAVRALIQLLDFSPTDPETWAELADVYLSQGMYPQAIHAMEEVLVLAPNAWNIQARLGEIQYAGATAPGAKEGSFPRYMAEALKRFARSIELCDDYLRGYYGLKLVTDRILKSPQGLDKRVDDGEFVCPDTGTVEKLNELATAKLAEIIRRYAAREKDWRGYDESEISAARALLSQKE